MKTLNSYSIRYFFQAKNHTIIIFLLIFMFNVNFYNQGIINLKMNFYREIDSEKKYFTNIMFVFYLTINSLIFRNRCN